MLIGTYLNSRKGPQKVLTSRRRYSNIMSFPESRSGEMVDTQRSGRCALSGMGVRVSPSACRVKNLNPLYVSSRQTRGLRCFLHHGFLPVDSNLTATALSLKTNLYLKNPLVAIVLRRDSSALRHRKLIIRLTLAEERRGYAAGSDRSLDR